MPAWNLNWNDLKDAEKKEIIEAAEYNVCSCCGHPGQAALEMFNAVISVIEARDRREIEATLAG